MWAGRKYLLTKATMVHGGTDQGEPEAGERLAKRKQIAPAMAAKRMVAAMGCPLQLCPQDAHPPVLSEQSEKHSQSSLRVRLPRTTRCASRASYVKYTLRHSPKDVPGNGPHRTAPGRQPGDWQGQMPVKERMLVPPQLPPAFHPGGGSFLAQGSY